MFNFHIVQILESITSRNCITRLKFIFLEYAIETKINHSDIHQNEVFVLWFLELTNGGESLHAYLPKVLNRKFNKFQYFSVLSFSDKINPVLFFILR